MDRMLVGIDGSTAAHEALRWSADLAGRLGAELLVVRVFAATQAELRPDIDAALHDEQRAELERWCTSLPPQGVGPQRMMLLDGDPAPTLLAAAEELGAELLVVGGRGTSGPTPVHLGSVAQELAEYATIPLAMVSDGSATPLRHVVVGVDGSRDSTAAIAFAAALAGPLGLAVTAVHAREPATALVPRSDPASWLPRAEAEVHDWVTPLERAGIAVEVDVDSHVRRVTAITRALDVHPGSAAVVGAHALSEVSGMRLGRLPLELVHHTGVPVIVVPVRRP
jgi:nucleotide-binding universal stress UspA family protein